MGNFKRFDQIKLSNSIFPVDENSSPCKLASEKYADDLSSNYVQTTNDQTISGVKTFNDKMTLNSNVLGGSKSTCSGDNAIAIGYNVHAEGNQSHAEGNKTNAKDKCAHAEGQSTNALSANAHAEGNGTTASGENSHAEGDQCIASGKSAHAEGYKCTASGENAHAEGHQSVASGQFSHAEGDQCTAGGTNSFAQGYKSRAYGNASYALGQQSVTSADYAYVWSGSSGGRDYIVSAENMSGTYNIDPVGGINGFYIGDQNLCSILSSYSTDNGKCVHISGDSNIGNLQLSGGLSVEGRVTFSNSKGLSGFYIGENTMDALIDNKISATLGNINSILDKLING